MASAMVHQIKYGAPHTKLSNGKDLLVFGAPIHLVMQSKATHILSILNFASISFLKQRPDVPLPIKEIHKAYIPGVDNFARAHSHRRSSSTSSRKPGAITSSS